MLAAWLLPMLLLLAALAAPTASANIPRLAESRVGLPRDFAPAIIKLDTKPPIRVY